MAFVMLTTVGTEEEANLLAEEIVRRRQAACVNIIPGIRSTYRWKGKVCRDSEYMLIIKTSEAEYDAVAATVGELHSYELPELLAFNIRQGNDGFLDWIRTAVDKSGPADDDDDD